MDQERVTVVKEGGGAGWFFALVLLFALIVGAYLFTRYNDSAARKNDAIAGAAKDVGDAAKDVGDAVKKETN
ncbi:MAG: hypothetical protein U1E37_07945 [Sphingomonadaceae bacterium]